MKTLSGYHFTGDTLRDGSPIPPIGKWLVHKGEVVPCACGLHMSEHPFDALRYAPGKYLHKIELRGDLTSHAEGGKIDKWVGRERKIMATIDAEKLMRDFARWGALQVVYLWPNAPKVVLDYLKTGAWAAAWDAASDAFEEKSRQKFLEMVEESFNNQSK